MTFETKQYSAWEIIEKEHENLQQGRDLVEKAAAKTWSGTGTNQPAGTTVLPRLQRILGCQDGTGPEWEHVKVASTEQGPPLLQAEVHKRRESATQESRTLSVTCTACETEAG